MKSIGKIVLLIILLLLSKAISYSQLVCIEAPGYTITNKTITVCGGTGVNLTAKDCSNGAFHDLYQWTNPNDEIQPLNGTNSFYALDSGMWVVTDLSYDPDPVTDTIYIKYFPLAVTLSKKPCAGDTFSLSLSAGAEFSAFEWYKKGNLFNTGSKVVQTSVAQNETNIFPIEVKSKHSSGCTSSLTEWIPIIQSTKINLGKDTSICNGDSITLKAPSNVVREWFYNGTKVSINETFIAKKTGNYRLYVKNNNECVSHDTISLTATPKPEITLTTPVVICPNTPFKINPNIVNPGTSPYTARWLPKEGISDTTAFSPFVTTSQAKQYRAIFTDSKNCKDTSSITINLHPALNVTTTIAEATVCQNGAVTLGGNISGGTPSTTGTPYSFKWYPEALITDLTTMAPEVRPTSPTLFYLVGTDANNCKDTAYTNIKISTVGLSTQILPGKRDLCFNDSLYLEASIAGGEPGFTYQWTSPSSSFRTGTDLKSWAKPTASGSITYQFTVEDRLKCQATASIVVNAVTAPTLALGPSSVILCQTDSLAIKPMVTGGAGAPYKYQWQNKQVLTFTSDSSRAKFKAITPGQFIIGLTAVDGIGCKSNLGTTEFNVYEAPNVELGPLDTFGCQGQSLQLSSPSSLRKGLAFRWVNLDLQDTISRDSSLNINYDGRIKLVVKHPQAGCSKSDIINVLFGPPPPSASIQSAPSVCNNTPLRLIAEPYASSYNYEWTAPSDIGTILNPNNDTIYFIPINSPSGSVTIGLTIKNSCGAQSATSTISLNVAPNVSGFVVNQNIITDTLITLSSNPNPEDTVYWGFRDGSSLQKGDSVSTIFNEPGQYTVLLIAKNNNSCIDTNFVTINVNLNPNRIQEIFVPNVFAPPSANSDNNALKVFGKNISSNGFSFRVFNRWGEVLYETSDFSEANTFGWNGTNSATGTPQSIGIYTFIVKGKYIDGTAFEKSGQSTLLR